MNKQRLKQLLYGYELRTTAAISNGLVHRVPKRTVLNTLKKELSALSRRISLSKEEIQDIWASTLSRYDKVSRQTFTKLRKTDKNYKENLQRRRNETYETMRNELPNLELDKNKFANQVEHRKKEEELAELLSSGVFYLCSTHTKPAKDHENWEGKVYVSENWRERVDKRLLRKKISSYIKKNHIRTVEWVTGAPVYLIFRPNCKHYLIEVSVDEVLGESVKTLLKRHKMYMVDKIPMSDAKRAYLGYYERFKALLELYEMCPSEKLMSDIKKTKVLVLKWKRRAESGQ